MWTVGHVGAWVAGKPRLASWCPWREAAVSGPDGVAVFDDLCHHLAALSAEAGPKPPVLIRKELHNSGTEGEPLAAGGATIWCRPRKGPMRKHANTSGPERG
jgi:hypothetical protein